MEEQLLEIPAPDYDDDEVDDNDVVPDVTPDVSDAVVSDANDNISPWDDDAVSDVAAPAAADDDVAAVAAEENFGTGCSAERWEDDEDGQVFRVLKEKLERYSADEIRQMLASASGVTETEGGDDSIPDPDYSDDDGENSCPASNEVFQSTNKDQISTTITSQSDRNSEQPNNANKPEVPLLKERKNLQRELKLMQKLGVESVLEKKPELIKVLEDRKEKNKKKELDAYLKTKRSSFEAKLEEQANKLNLAEEQKEREANPTKTKEEETEFLKMHSKIIKTKSNDCSN